ncbi:alpha-galactosidase [Lachnospiraceae bacterium 48-42]|nr:hypothetical protein [Dorea sp.]
MNNENFHPVQKIPPVAHALHKWEEETRTLSYEYNGIDILTAVIPGNGDVGYRHGSDGTMQSVAYAQQIYLETDAPAWVTLRFRLGRDAVNMKPRRAEADEAVLGQCGNLLLYGVNGLYDVDQDLLIDVNGTEWYWETPCFEEEEGFRIARMCVKLSKKAVFINLRMHYYRSHLGYRYFEPWRRRPNPKSVAGWCSWEAYRRDIDIQKVRGIAEFMEKKLKAYGLEYIQVDDGYQKMPLPYDPQGTMEEGWMTCEESKFPDGHSSIVEAIQSRGFLPAIWTNANITNEDFPRYHPDSVLFYEGRPLKGEWIDYLYNCTEETLQKHVRPVFSSLKKAGYRYVKIDAIRHLLLDGLHEAVRLGMMDNEEASRKFRSYMEATREGLGEDVYYLASWGEMHEVIGVADACRISMDANPTWAGIRMQLFESARWFHTQRILFLNDPDHVCVRTKPEWAKSVLSLISLSGGLYMLSDTEDAYTEEKLEIIRKTMPPLQTRTAETGPLNLEYPAYTWTKLHGFAVQSDEKPVSAGETDLEDAYNMAGNFPGMDRAHPFSTLWSFHLNHHGRTWCTAGRFATLPLSESDVPLEKLGLDPGEDYYVFDFWEQKYLGCVRGSFKGKELKLGCCQITAFYKRQEYPQLIGSSRHVSMDAVSVLEERWEKGALHIALQCIAGTTETYTAVLPEGFGIPVLRCEGAVCRMIQDGNILSISVSAEKEMAELCLLWNEEETTAG